MVDSCETRPRRTAGPGNDHKRAASDVSEIAQILPAKQENSAADRTRLQFLIRQLYRLRERPLFQFIDELERGAPLREPLEICATLDPDFIKALGGDRFVPFFAIVGRVAQ